MTNIYSLVILWIKCGFLERIFYTTRLSRLTAPFCKRENTFHWLLRTSHKKRHIHISTLNLLFTFNIKLFIKHRCDSPCGGCFSLQMTHFHCHCKVEEAEVGSHHGDRGTLRVGLKEVEGARVLDLCPSGHFHCPVARGCAPSAAHSSSSSPWPLAGCCRHNRLGPALWLRPRSVGSYPRSSGRRGYGCVSLPGRWGLLLLLCAGRQASSLSCGHHGRSHCEHCCSTHRLSWGQNMRKGQ